MIRVISPNSSEMYQALSQRDLAHPRPTTLQFQTLIDHMSKRGWDEMKLSGDQSIRSSSTGQLSTFVKSGHVSFYPYLLSFNPSHPFFFPHLHPSHTIYIWQYALIHLLLGLRLFSSIYASFNRLYRGCLTVTWARLMVCFVPLSLLTIQVLHLDPQPQDSYLITMAPVPDKPSFSKRWKEVVKAARPSASGTTSRQSTETAHQDTQIQRYSEYLCCLFIWN